MNDQTLEAWERAARARDPHEGVPGHARRGTAAPSTPAVRVVELTLERNLLREYLLEACVAMRELAREGGEVAGRVEALEADYDRWRRFKETSFGGVAMAQYQVDLYAWEAVLNTTPGLTGIVEIGTWRGGFSGWLWAQSRLRGLKFFTCDVVRPDGDLRFTGFCRVDVFAQPEAIEDTIRSFGEPLVLFCDGGNKPRELRTFAPMLEDPRSLVLVHDWGTETTDADVPDFLEPAFLSHFEGLGSITRAFRRRA